MISLSDKQLQIVMPAAATLPVEKRAVYLERLAAELQRRGRFGDADVVEAAQAAIRGPIQERVA